MKKVVSLICNWFGGLLLFVLPAIAWAAAGVPVDPEVPAWVYQLLGVAAGLIGIVSQVDAQISEEFKHKWPWWLRLIWDVAAGNYKHSQNIGSV